MKGFGPTGLVVCGDDVPAAAKRVIVDERQQLAHQTDSASRAVLCRRCYPRCSAPVPHWSRLSLLAPRPHHLQPRPLLPPLTAHYCQTSFSSVETAKHRSAVRTRHRNFLARSPARVQVDVHGVQIASALLIRRALQRSSVSSNNSCWSFGPCVAKAGCFCRRLCAARAAAAGRTR